MTTPKTAHERAMRSTKERMGSTATVEEVVSAYLAALEREGWQLVPKEPTLEMIQIGGEVNSPTISLTHARDYAFDVYRAMLAAAPSAQEEE